MAYKIKYDDDADVLTIILKKKGKLSHAEEVVILLFILIVMGSLFSWRFSRLVRWCR